MGGWFESELWGTAWSRFVEWAVETVPAIVLIIGLALIALLVVSRSIEVLRHRMMQGFERSSRLRQREAEKRIDTLFGIGQAVARTVIGAIALMTLLDTIGLDIAPVLAGAGVVGLAVGFGAQELVRDVISGFFLLLENHVRSGDRLTVNGTTGRVESVGLRTLVLRDARGTVHIFQNSKISSLSNMSKGWSAFVLDMGISYSEDTDRVSEVMIRVAEEVRDDPVHGENVLEAMEVLGVEEFADNSVVVRARMKVRPGQQFDIAREYRRRLKKAFDREGIEIPFPQRTVHIVGDDGSGGGPSVVSSAVE